MEAPKTAPGPTDQKLHFLDYWRIIRIRKTVILAVFLLVVLTTTAVTFILDPTYRSTVRMEVQKDMTDIAPLLMGVQAQSTFDPYFIQTEFEKIKSKNVLYEVIEELRLQDVWKERFGMDEPMMKTDAYEYLKKQIEVRQFRNTSLIEVQVYSRDYREAADIANMIAQVYQRSRLERSKTASQEAVRILGEKLEESKKELLLAQRAMDDLRSELGVADIELGSVVSLVEPEIVRDFERRRALVQMELTHYESILSELKNIPKKDLPSAIPTTTVKPDSRLPELLARLDLARTEQVQLAEELGPDHPRSLSLNKLVIELEEQIEASVKGILDSLEYEVNRRQQQLIALEQKVKEARDKDAERLAAYRPYLDAKRGVETQTRILEAMKLRVLQETVDAELPKSSIVEITDPAEADPKPVRPNVPLNIALGVMVGLIMGFGLAFFIEYLDTSVKTIDDVERALQAPVLGVIPQNVGSLLQEGPESPHAEAYRVLRTNLLFSKKNPQANSLTVVSGGAGEGKSTTIFNLATVFAQHGHRVLLVDSDLRRPSLHKLLNVSNSVGLTNYLLKQNTIEEVIQTTDMPSLFFLPSGKLPSSSLGILNSTQMKEFIVQAKERFDFVFFDSPPIMGVSDASVLASAVDLALLVIQYRKYPQAMTIRAKQMVEKVGGTLLGVVLNNINISQDSYYYYYSGYYYDYYSKHDDSDSEGTKKNGESKSGVPSERANLDLKKKY